MTTQHNIDNWTEIFDYATAGEPITVAAVARAGLEILDALTEAQSRLDALKEICHLAVDIGFGSIPVEFVLDALFDAVPDKVQS